MINLSTPTVRLSQEFLTFSAPGPLSLTQDGAVIFKAVKLTRYQSWFINKTSDIVCNYEM